MWFPLEITQFWFPHGLSHKWRKPRMDYLGLEVVRGEAAFTRAKEVSEDGGESVLEVMDVESAPGRRN